SGSTCHQDCPAAASQSTNLNAPAPRRPSGSEATCSRMPLDRGRFIVRVHNASRVAVSTARMSTLPKTRPARIQIQRVWPMIDCGRSRAKRSLGDEVDAWADIFGDGHDVVRAVIRYRAPGARRYDESPLEPIGNDRWHGSFTVTALGRWQYTITAWIDP